MRILTASLLVLTGLTCTLVGGFLIFSTGGSYSFPSVADRTTGWLAILAGLSQWLLAALLCVSKQISEISRRQEVTCSRN